MPTDAGKTASTSGQDVDVAQLSTDPEKIKVLMKRDPKFITRLISQLDKSMHALMLEKLKRRQAIEEAQKEIDRINETIRTHVTPNLERLEASIKTKKETKESVSKQVDAQMSNVKDLEAEARAVIQKARHTAGKLMRNTASQRLEEARGFNASAPTTTILKAAAASSGKGTARPKPS